MCGGFAAAFRIEIVLVHEAVGHAAMSANRFWDAWIVMSIMQALAQACSPAPKEALDGGKALED